MDEDAKEGTMEMGETTTITVLKGTRDHLKILKQKGENYDEIINKLIEIAEKVDLLSKQKHILDEDGFIHLDQV